MNLRPQRKEAPLPYTLLLLLSAGYALTHTLQYTRLYKLRLSYVQVLHVNNKQTQPKKKKKVQPFLISAGEIVDLKMRKISCLFGGLCKYLARLLFLPILALHSSCKGFCLPLDGVVSCIFKGPMSCFTQTRNYFFFNNFILLFLRDYM